MACCSDITIFAHQNTYRYPLRRFLCVTFRHCLQYTSSALITKSVNFETTRECCANGHFLDEKSIIIFNFLLARQTSLVALNDNQHKLNLFNLIFGCIPNVPPRREAIYVFSYFLAKLGNTVQCK